jgi:hypothetical protein
LHRSRHAEKPPGQVLAAVVFLLSFAYVGPDIKPAASTIANNNARQVFILLSSYKWKEQQRFNPATTKIQIRPPTI